MRSRCLAVLPNAGLGNILFPWAHAHVFAQLNDLPASALGWWRPHIGPMLRGENRLRFYGNSFDEPVAEVAACMLLGMTASKVRNPPVQRVEENAKHDRLFMWDAIPHWSDFFGELRPFRDLVKDLIWRKVNPSVRMKAMTSEPATVAVHIRCGDFRMLREGEEFKSVGNTRTPLDYFVSTIQEVRRCHGRVLPVTVFTDGRPSDIQAVLDLPAVRIAPRDKPIVDLLSMSRAGLIIVSASSTFSYWAGFLSDGPVLLHPDHIHAPHRPSWVNSVSFEGPAIGAFETWPELLVNNLRSLRRPDSSPPQQLVPVSLS